MAPSLPLTAPPAPDEAGGFLPTAAPWGRGRPQAVCSWSCGVRGSVWGGITGPKNPWDGLGWKGPIPNLQPQSPRSWFKTFTPRPSTPISDKGHPGGLLWGRKSGSWHRGRRSRAKPAGFGGEAAASWGRRHEPKPRGTQTRSPAAQRVLEDAEGCAGSVETLRFGGFSGMGAAPALKVGSGGPAPCPVPIPSSQSSPGSRAPRPQPPGKAF